MPSTKIDINKTKQNKKAKDKYLDVLKEEEENQT